MDRSGLQLGGTTTFLDQSSLAFASCGTFTQSPRTGGDILPPTVTNCSATPTSLPGTGGGITISATVTDNVAVASVSAHVTAKKPGTSHVAFDATVDLAAPAGSSAYSGTLAVPPSIDVGTRTYEVAIIASDSSGNVRHQRPHPDCTFTQASGDSVPPHIANCSISPHSLPAAGGQVAVSADVTDNIAVAQVIASVVVGNSTVSTTLVRQANGFTYTGTLSIPANSGAHALTLQPRVAATDSSGNVASRDCGTLHVARGGPAAPHGR
jgi:hypothetical protein